jgi:hypothetical protein
MVRTTATKTMTQAAMMAIMAPIPSPESEKSVSNERFRKIMKNLACNIIAAVTI